jgi:hypothetical protein
VDTVRQPWSDDEPTHESVKAQVHTLYLQHKDNVIPIEELWDILDAEMGEKTLTDELHAMREGR